MKVLFSLASFKFLLDGSVNLVFFLDNTKLESDFSKYEIKVDGNSLQGKKKSEFLKHVSPFLDTDEINERVFDYLVDLHNKSNDSYLKESEEKTAYLNSRLKKILNQKEKEIESLSTKRLLSLDSNKSSAEAKRREAVRLNYPFNKMQEINEEYLKINEQIEKEYLSDLMQIKTKYSSAEMEINREIIEKKKEISEAQKEEYQKEAQSMRLNILNNANGLDKQTYAFFKKTFFPVWASEMVVEKLLNQFNIKVNFLFKRKKFKKLTPYEKLVSQLVLNLVSNKYYIFANLEDYDVLPKERKWFYKGISKIKSACFVVFSSLITDMNELENQDECNFVYKDKTIEIGKLKAIKKEPLHPYLKKLFIIGAEKDFPILEGGSLIEISTDHFVYATSLQRKAYKRLHRLQGDIFTQAESEEKLSDEQKMALFAKERAFETIADNSLINKKELVDEIVKKEVNLEKIRKIKNKGEDLEINYLVRKNENGYEVINEDTGECLSKFEYKKDAVNYAKKLSIDNLGKYEIES